MRFDVIASLVVRNRLLIVAGIAVSLGPQPRGNRERFQTLSVPPVSLGSCGVQFAMMQKAERHHELVADLLAEPVWLGKPKMVRVRRLSPADQARKAAHFEQVSLVAQAPSRLEGESRLVDAWSVGDTRGSEREGLKHFGDLS